MPHGLFMCLGSAEAGWIAFVRHVPPDVPRIYLCDTFCDERCEARAAAQARAEAVHGGAWRWGRDTPRSSRRDMRAILGDVRWE